MANISVANSSQSDNPEFSNPTAAALDLVHRLNRYDRDEVIAALEAAQARYPHTRETGAQRISRLARVVGESFNHLSGEEA
jgi:hypothetical protein